MKHIIVGTAGHIDHGKTSLIRALTGRETDTLKEEKDRGISINLGFTYFDLPSGKRAGIIDVPGHEKFIKNMLAGISGIDIVMLVIAADEGVMPQTLEHLEILQLLNIKKGMVVLTKKDLVDEEWLAMVEEEVREVIKESFLAESPIIPVSSKTGEGIEKIMAYLDKAAEEVEAKDILGHFRMPVDRVFSISGFGTVVTGTIYSGRITLGETVEVYPSGIKGKIRNIQIHDQDMPQGEAGQRCALNIAGLKTEDIARGNVVAKEGALESSLMIDCTLNYLKSAAKPLENRQRVRLYYGTEEVLCRVIILDKEEMAPGDSAYVQLRLEKPVAMQRGDRYVIRSYSPMVTIGGGIVLEPVAKKAKRFNESYIKELKVKESGSTDSIVEACIERVSGDYPGVNDILKALGKNQEDLPEILMKLVEDKRILKLGSSESCVYLHNRFIMKKIEEGRSYLQGFHRDNPLKQGLSKEEFKNKIFSKKLKQKNYDEILELLVKDHVIAIEGNNISLEGFNIVYNKEQQQIKDMIMEEYKKAAFTPPRPEDIGLQIKNKKEFKAVMDSLLEVGELIKVNEECILYKDYFTEAKDLIVNFINEHGEITAAEYRNLLGTSRKYAVALLEYFDAVKLTKRVEDKRILLK